MPGEVIDTNVLRVASVLSSATGIATPVEDPDVVHRVFNWIKTFRDDRARHLVMDGPEQTIRKEYNNNLPTGSYGHQVMIDKFTKGSIYFAQLTYWSNGTERVANLPDPALKENFHDLGDRKFIAAAVSACAPIVNATDGDWTEPAVRAGLKQLGVEVVQLLSDEERQALRERE